MHEFSIAADIVETVSDFASAHTDKKILKVRLQVGELTCIEPVQLKFCYESMVPGTHLAGSTLEIEIVAAAVRCPKCHYQGVPGYLKDSLTYPVPTLQCPECGQSAEPVTGHECAIKNVQCMQLETEKTF